MPRGMRRIRIYSAVREYAVIYRGRAVDFFGAAMAMNEWF